MALIIYVLPLESPPDAEIADQQKRLILQNLRNVVGSVEEIYKSNVKVDSTFTVNEKSEEVQLLCRALEAILNYGIKRKRFSFLLNC